MPQDEFREGWVELYMRKVHYAVSHHPARRAGDRPTLCLRYSYEPLVAHHPRPDWNPDERPDDTCQECVKRLAKWKARASSESEATRGRRTAEFRAVAAAARDQLARVSDAAYRNAEVHKTHERVDREIASATGILERAEAELADLEATP